MKITQLISLPIFLLISNLFIDSTEAQITVDQTLPTNSLIFNNRSNVFIEGGTKSGNNLFHSFIEFNIRNNQSVIFSNPFAVENIFTRVTGNNPSSIFGTLSVNGQANLFFFNPNGITFGPNSSLSLGGSFLGTTADYFTFHDGTIFSASNPTSSVTMSRPIGLGFRPPTNTITIRGIGHPFSESSPFSPIIRDNNLPQGLNVIPGQNLALIGGNIQLEGATLSAFDGKIDLAAVGQGFVKITSSNQFEYEQVSFWNDITLISQAAIDASGLGRSKVSLYGQDIKLLNGSLILMQNLGDQGSSNIQIQGKRSVQIEGLAFTKNFASSILTQTLATGKAGTIEVKTPSLSLSDGAEITTTTFSSGHGGDLKVKAKSIEVEGFADFDPTIVSAISVLSFGAGESGSIEVSSNNLVLKNGGTILSVVFNSGNSGDVTISADLIDISGASSFDASSQIGSLAFADGNAGNIYINTKQLFLSQGGAISSTTFTDGNAGNINIEATELIKLSDIQEFDTSLLDLPSFVSNPTPLFSGLINSSAPIISRVPGNLPNFPTGNSGNINLITPQLMLSDGAVITVGNLGTGDAGNLSIQADLIILDNASRITSATLSGNGGNLFLSASNIVLSTQSEILSSALGKGSGGNIFIQTNPGLILLEGSQISANAIEGSGGNIQINANVALTSSDSQITATSELGIDGTVEIRTPENNLQSTIYPISAEILEVDPTIIQNCFEQTQEGGSFIIKGSGAIPPSPQNSPSWFEEDLPDLKNDLSKKDNTFHAEHLSPNALIKTEKGKLLAVNICLENLKSKSIRN